MSTADVIRLTSSEGPPAPTTVPVVAVTSADADSVSTCVSVSESPPKRKGKKKARKASGSPLLDSPKRVSSDSPKRGKSRTRTAAADASTAATSTLDTGVRVASESPPKEKRKKKKKAEVNTVLKDARTPADVRVAVIGNVDSGKSTVIGVLVSGISDDGRGLARKRVLRHGHELESGRTSSVSHQMVGFGSALEPIYGVLPMGAKPKQKTEAWTQIVSQASNVVTFIDLAGHEKYLKTTISGLTGCFPDYALIVVGSNMGVSKMTREHIQVAVALEIALFVVVTKIDICPEDVLQRTLRQLAKLLRSPACNKMPIIMRRLKDVNTCFKKDAALQKICPVFLVSAVSSSGIDRVVRFLSKLRPKSPWKHPLSEMVQKMNDALERAAMDKLKKATASSGASAMSSLESDVKRPLLSTIEGISAEVEIDDTFAVRGVGVVLSGTVTAGKLCANQRLFLGPLSDGGFREIQVKSIHLKRVAVEFAKAGENCSMSFRFVKRKDALERSQIRRGMVAVSDCLKPRPAWGFRAKVLVLHHPTTIGCGYQPVIHCGGVRQSASIVRMSAERLRSGDAAMVDFQFIKEPEFLHLNRPVIIREGSTKCIGKVVKIYDEYEPKSFGGSFFDYISALPKGDDD